MDSGLYHYQPFQRYQKETIKQFFAVESESVDPEIFKKKHMRILRDHVVRLICIQSRTTNFDAYIPYLAVNYFDRFISRNPLPIIPKKDLNYCVLVLSLCCLSLACKIRNYASFFIFIKEIRHLEFDRKHLIELELKILNGLEWKMHSVNAMCFVRYFMTISSIPSLSFRRISEIIIQAQGDINFTEFKPSVLAASATLTAIHFQARDIVDFCKEILTKGGLIQLNESEVNKCMNSMIGIWVHMGNVENAPSTGTSASATAGQSSVGGTSPQRPGKELVSEIEEVPEFIQILREIVYSNPLPAESKEKYYLSLDFELKWITTKNESLLMTLDPALFSPESKRSRVRTWLKDKFCMYISAQKHKEDEALLA